MKSRRTQFLLFVALVSSATVVQIREHMPQTGAVNATESTTCGATRDGLIPASCEPTRAVEGASGTRDTQGQPGLDGNAVRTPHAPLRVWV
ncbi:hypothetical protein [Paraburkholderia sp.]|uniref:hypothetical protein n=1 Tax=Paraburkholderia sp. TaxID=1926495 RepID=UPI002386D399|nr:hypothetical protein [Paraburkholderia sp.]MDE1181652.1 hypothetical protein [Paraburkholderia sp.]